MDTSNTSMIRGERSDVREGKRVIWWNVVIGLVIAGVLYRVVPSYSVFITLLVLIRILAIIFEFMLFRAFRQVSIFTSIPGIAYAWGAAFLSTVATYSYEVGEASFHYGMSVSPYYQIPPDLFLGIEGVALLFLGFYFGKLPYGYGKLSFYGRMMHTVFGLVLLAQGALAASGALSYLTALTFPLAAIMLFFTVLVEYLTLSRTLLLQAQGSIHYPPPQAQLRGMFDHMGDFGYVRNATQAIGFYFVYLSTIFVSYLLLILIVRRVFPAFDYEGSAAIIGTLASALISTLLAFIVTRERHALKRFSSLFLLILTLLVSLYGKLGVGLALVAYMTTRRAGSSIVTTTLPTPSPTISPASAPFPPHHDPKHLALTDNDVDVTEEVHINAAATPAKKTRASKKSSAKKPASPDTVGATSLIKRETKAKPKITRTRKTKVVDTPVEIQKTALEENLREASAGELPVLVKDDSKVKNIIVTSPVIRDAG